MAQIEIMTFDEPQGRMTFYVKNDDGSYSELGSRIVGAEFGNEPYVVEATSALEPFSASRRRKPEEFADVDYTEVDNGQTTSK